MEFIGDLERAFAAAIYPNRVAIGIAVVVGLIVLAVVARRRGWPAAARRHPGRLAAILVPSLVIGLPLAWYLASPLVLTARVDDEPIPSGAPVSEIRGMFQGADEFHFGSGTARLVETAPGEYVVRLEDFAVRNGPDLYVYLSPSADGYTADAIELGRLKADTGNQNYEVPAGVDAMSARSVVIWCRGFSVEFATAVLGAG